jgi:alkylation response protein AidB-like acyl-CoA dehydrogenase
LFYLTINNWIFMWLLELVILLCVVWYALFSRLAPLAWVLLVGIVLLGETVLGGMPTWLFILCWALYAIIAIFAVIKPLRMVAFTLPFLSRFRKVLPAMSNTEREALEAGDVWWEGDLFAGRPNWTKLHAIPKPSLTQDEQDFINNETETLCSLLDDWKIMNEDRDLSKAAWDYLKQQGFFGLVIDKSYGGKGFSAYAHSTVVTKIASRSMSAAVTAMVPNSLGPGELLAHYGTEEQKDYYLPRLARGEDVPCFALTSLDAGSDAGAMRDSGVVTKGMHEGKEVVGIRLSWSKRYITLAPVATVLGMAFKLTDPDHLLGENENIGITLALLPTSHPGVKVGDRHFPMGLAFMNGPTEGEDVFIPLDWVVGGKDMVGKGWRMLMECLSIGRAISLPALGAAAGRLAYYGTGIYAHLRKQFKIPLGQFEGVQAGMACIAGNTYFLEASRRMTAGAVDLKFKPSVVSAIQKYHATELARTMTDAAMDIHAGRAVQFGPRNYIGQAYVGLPISITVEGANILTRNLIIFGQGAIRCHPYVLKEMQAANDTNKRRGLRAFDKELLSHIGYTSSNIVRAITFGFTRAKFVKAPNNSPLGYYYKQLTRMSTALALCSDFAMLILGGQLKRKERLSARLGDVLSYLYLSSTVLKYYADQASPAEDLPYVKWCLETGLFKMQTAFDKFLLNFPNQFVAGVLRSLIFPFGKPYHGPSDKLETQIVQTMMQQPSVLRARLTANIYVPDDETDCLGRMEAAFKAAYETEDLEARIKQAISNKNMTFCPDMTKQVVLALEVGIINANEADKLLHAQALIRDAMEVDTFPKDYFTNP